MSDIGIMVAELIAAGCAPEVAAEVVASAFVAGAASSNFRGIPVDKTAEKRRAYDRERKRKSTGNPPESTGLPETPLSTKSSIKKVDRQNRGSRITPDWTPSDAERSFAKQEGFSATEIDREVGKFRDHWAATAGSKGVKLDWAATWRKWIRNAADWGGKAPPAAPGSVVVSFYAQGGSEQLDAWNAHTLKTTGKPLPRDKNQGWHVKAEWPPGYVPLEKTHDPPPALGLRAMQ